MSQTERGWTDEQVEQVVGTLLRSGVIIAALVVLMGGILYLIRYGATFPDYRVFRAEPAGLRSVSGIFKETLSFHSHGLIQLGLLLLIATPIARVAFSIFAFTLQRDRTYVIITLIVFAVLMYSLLGGGLYR
jgi:uncharacterized membrane protein